MKSLLALLLGSSLIFGSGALIAQDNISKFLLIKLSREQSAVFCASAEFAECMSFSQEKCLALSESAIETCLAPLPDRINPTELENSSLEACPIEVYEEAGYSEEKAKECAAQVLDGS